MNRPTPPEVRPARPEELRRLGEVLGAAFWDDPVWEWVCPDPARRRAHLGHAFAAVMASRVRNGWAWTTPGVLGGAIWTPPGRWKTSRADDLRAALPMLRAIGARNGVPARLAALSRIEAHHPSEPHWYLAVLGTDPELRGRGLGSALLAPMIERLNREGVPAFLESSKEDNLPFYARFGFEVTGELSLADGGPTMWAMWREPR